MALLFPNNFDKSNTPPGEQMLFKKFSSDTENKDWNVLHSLDLSKHVNIMGEADFVVVSPKLGLLVIEVKSHRKISFTEEGWCYGNSKKFDYRGPFKQAKEAMYAIKEYLEKIDKYFSKVLFTYAACFPLTEFKTRSPEWHQWQIIDADMLYKKSISQICINIFNKEAEHMKSRGREFAEKQYLFSSEKVCNKIIKILRPKFETPDFFIKNSEQEKLLSSYTEEQFSAIDVMNNNERVIFTGAAGTGKTLLALESLRRAQNEYQKNRIALFCYNRFLGEHLEKFASERIPGVIATNIHRWIKKEFPICYSNFDESQSNSWDILLTSVLEEIVGSDKFQNYFDFIIIDEAQDFFGNSLYLILESLIPSGIPGGKWRMFGDFEGQNIFNSKLDYKKQFDEVKKTDSAHYNLSINCRNTKPISTYIELLGGIKNPYSKILRDEINIQPDFAYYKNENEQINLVTASINQLNSDGYKDSDIVLLSPFTNECIAKKLLEKKDWQNRISEFSIINKDKILYTTIGRFKGLEAPAIIITDFMSMEMNQNLFYVGISRALHRLSIFLHVKLKNNINKILIN